jgi:lactoylglutathione lyase
MGEPAFPAPREGMIVTVLLIVSDQDRTRDFYTRVLGAAVVRERDPLILRIHNTWITANVGGGPTEDKPGVEMVTPTDPSRVSAMMNIRVADIQAVYEDWRGKGATFLTPPQDRGAEFRCYFSGPGRPPDRGRPVQGRVGTQRCSRATRPP